MAETIYHRALAITQDYLGPAAQRFVDRQIGFHLQKEPEALTSADIPQLAEWVKVSITILTEDHAMVDEFAERILGLLEPSHD